MLAPGFMNSVYTLIQSIYITTTIKSAAHKTCEWVSEYHGTTEVLHGNNHLHSNHGVLSQAIPGSVRHYCAIALHVSWCKLQPSHCVACVATGGEKTEGRTSHWCAGDDWKYLLRSSHRFGCQSPYEQCTVSHYINPRRYNKPTKVTQTYREGGGVSIRPLLSIFDTIHPIDLIFGTYNELSLYFQLG